MTSNPLARRRIEAADYAPRAYRTPQEHADYLNATMTRVDVEWVVGEQGLFLRDKPMWSINRTRQIERQREHDRQDWKRAQAQAHAAPEA